MMQVTRRKSFKKAYLKLNARQRQRVDEAIALFLQNPDHPSLRLHELQPKGCGRYSINVGGDLRCLFFIGEDSLVFVALGTHAQLYG